MTATLELNPVEKISRDLRNATRHLSTEEARFFVDSYYSMQKYRITSGNQVHALSKIGDPVETTGWLLNQYESLESSVAKALDAYSADHKVGRWARSIVGIGPVIAAALLAHIDIEKAPTAGHIWSFAGLNPTVKWSKGQKRPWNARLKVVCWKLGESFVKVSNNENDIYGKLYASRKALETERNESLMYADQAKAALAAKRFGTDTVARQCYELGKLPPARIHLRAERYAVKIFLAHLHEAMHVDRYGKMPPKPYVLEHLGHVHKIEAPNKHLIPGWENF